MEDVVVNLAELHEQRHVVAENLKECIRDRGYTKVSFAKKARISLDELDAMLDGNVKDREVFYGLLRDVLVAFNMSAEELMEYSGTQKKSGLATDSLTNHSGRKISETAEKQYKLLEDILDLCAIYY